MYVGQIFSDSIPFLLNIGYPNTKRTLGILARKNRTLFFNRTLRSYMTHHCQERAAAQHFEQLPLTGRRHLLKPCLQVRIASKGGCKGAKVSKFNCG